MVLQAYCMYCCCTARMFVGELMPLFLLQVELFLQDNQGRHKPEFFIQLKKSLDCGTAVHRVFSLNLIFKCHCELKLEDVGSTENRIAFWFRNNEYLRNSKYLKYAKHTYIFTISCNGFFLVQHSRLRYAGWMDSYLNFLPLSINNVLLLI